VIQKEAHQDAQTAELVIMTHLAREASMLEALRLLRNLQAVREVGSFIRVEHL
jgi:homoserine dehydrogenase